MSNNLTLNGSKTKEIVVDYRRNKLTINPLLGKEVERVESLKLLYKHLTEDMTWSINTKFISKIVLF